ncbi:hypothetical protein [Pseudomonas sp. JUb96]|nr:hypothetical protein [Pseudomonas sp. JUb96]MCW2267596.1 hypothetical protein [Pseudomonas sp. JUb96]
MSRFIPSPLAVALSLLPELALNTTVPTFGMFAISYGLYAHTLH